MKRISRYLLMLLMIMLGSLVLLHTSFAETPIKLLTASATSTSDDSKPITDLLDLSKEGAWNPKALDSGKDEGLFFQFETPVLLDYIQVKLRNTNKCSLAYYLDGKLPVKPKNKTKVQSEDGAEDNGVEYGQIEQKIGKDLLITLGARDFEKPETVQPLKVKVRSIYLRILNKPKTAPIVAVRFFRGGLKQPLPVEVMQSITGTASASNTLQPELAYSVSNLFDSRTDFAWATDGKKSKGVGELLEINFDQATSLAGMMLWNGYQRSKTHYLANARPAKLRVTINDTEFLVNLKDQQGVQKIKFPKFFEGVTKLKLKVEQVFPGSSYRDMVLSELRFLDAAERIVMLETPGVVSKVTNSRVKPLVDCSFEPYMLGIAPMDADCFFFGGSVYPHKSIRFRSDGSFVFYLEYLVMEGNWESTPKGIRVFGKKYQTTNNEAIYLQAKKEATQVQIFQAEIEVLDLKQLTPVERRKFFKALIVERDSEGTLFKKKQTDLAWWMGIRPYQQAQIKLTNEAELIEAAYQVALKQQAIALRSPLFIDLFLPSDEVCASYFDS